MENIWSISELTAMRLNGSIGFGDGFLELPDTRCDSTSAPMGVAGSHRDINFATIQSQMKDSHTQIKQKIIIT